MTVPTLPSSEVGRNARRSMTDVWALVMFAIFWALLIVLMGTAFSHGHPASVLYGTDYEGNRCGVGAHSHRPNIWYPISFSKATGSFSISAALDLGVCVSDCHALRIGDKVETYGCTDKQNCGNIPDYYRVYFQSTPTLYHCVPSFLSFDCQNVSSCMNQRHSGKDKFLKEIGWNSFMYGLVQDLSRSYGMLFVMTLVAIILSYVWLYSLRVTIKPMIAITIVASLLLMLTLSAMSLARYHKAPDQSAESAKIYLAAGIIGLLITFLYVCFLVYANRDIMLSCEIIIEASRVVVEIPQTVAVPVISAIFVVCIGVLFAANALFIYTSGSLKPVDVPLVSNTSAVAKSTRYVYAEWRTIGQLYNVFMFLWTMGLFHAISMTVIAFCAVQWYWSTPGDVKQVPDSPVSWSVRTIFFKHMGTLALGSFLIAIVQFCRVLLRMMEKRLRVWTADGNTTAKFVFCIADCLLACFERIVKFLTTHAYVMTAMTGDGLLPGARHACQLLCTQLSVLFLNIIGEAVITIGKLCLTLLVVLFGWAWLHALNEDRPAPFNYGVILLILALITFFVTSVFASVFTICIDSVLLCYCYDRVENNGADKPHFFPKALGDRVTTAHTLGNRKKGGQESDEAQSLIK